MSVNLQGISGCSCGDQSSWSYTNLIAALIFAVSAAVHGYFYWKRTTNPAPIESLARKSVEVPMEPVRAQEAPSSENVEGSSHNLSREELIAQIREMGSRVSVAKPKRADSPYARLTHDLEYRTMSIQLFTTLADGSISVMMKNMGMLLTSGKTLESKGVHPLKFMELAVTDKELRPHFKKVFQDLSKRKDVMNPSFAIKLVGKAQGYTVKGVKEKLDERAKAGELDSLIDGFAEAVGRNRSDIQGFFKDRNWEGLFEELLIDRP